jgi:PPOX class probable F420-dependent enzyme
MTVIWPIAWDDGKVAFLTPMPSGKAKRLRHTPRVKLQASDWDGFPIQGRPPVEGSAELVEGEERDRVFAAVVAKYGQDAWDAAMGRGREYFASRGIEYAGDYAVIVTPDT